MDSSWLDLSHLPEIFALAIVIGCFRPLVRRAGPHVNLWFVGWTFLLLHCVTATFLPTDSLRNPWLYLLDRACFSMAILLFAMTAETNPIRRLKWPMPAILAVPLLFQSAMTAFPIHPPHLDRLAVLLFLAPALFLLFTGAQHQAQRSRQGMVFGTAYLILSGLTLAYGPMQALLVGRAEVTLLLLGAALLFARSSPRAHRGVVAAVTGLAAWALTWPLLTLCWRIGHPVQLPATIP